jgi:soluble epoxide hydrolase / lipid-phosphate phosphatase
VDRKQYDAWLCGLYEERSTALKLRLAVMFVLMIQQDIHVIRQEILDGGITSSLHYYKAYIQTIDLEDTLNLSM